MGDHSALLKVRRTLGGLWDGSWDWLEGSVPDLLQNVRYGMTGRGCGPEPGDRVGSNFQFLKPNNFGRDHFLSLKQPLTEKDAQRVRCAWLKKEEEKRNLF